jgi:hypothetical protein
MARMIPATIHSSVRSGAERRMFHIIQNTKGTDDWVCLHSLNMARHASKRRGEIDFVLLSPLGVLILEVKGGRVARRDGVWIFTDRHGETHRKTEGPFEQAASAMFSLEKEVRSHFPDSPIADALFGYGILFPDIEFDSLGCESDPALVYDVRDRRRSFVAYVQRVTEFAREREPRRRRGLTREQILHLADFLRCDFDLVPSLKVVIEDTRNELAELTKEQRVVLDVSDDAPRVVVEGPAGSGKTLLAIEAARREARRGARVLLLCYNRMLAERIRSAIDGERYRGTVTTRTVHGHFARLIESSSLKEEFDGRAREEPEERIFSTLYPEYAALAALEEVETPHDVLIVDEAQDVLTDATCTVLSESLRSGLSGGRWRLFLDSNNQACVYGRMDPAVLERLRGWAATHFLTHNCRNTRPIALHTNVLSDPQRKTEGRVEGLPVQFLSYRNEDERWQKLGAALAEIRRENVSAGAVSILLPRTPSDEEIGVLQGLGARRLREQDVPLLGTERLTQLTWSVTSGFKGLENDVIILVGVEDIETSWWKAVNYVAMSRARARLWVLIRADCEELRNDRLQRELERRLSGSEMIV